MQKFKPATEALPYTPADVLDISTSERETEIAAAVEAATKSGVWRQPYQDAATDLKEMTLTDIFYWVYKSENPIELCENGQNADSILQRDKSLIGIPANFEKASSLTIGAGGDLLQAPGLEASGNILFENIADIIFEQDLSYANYESPVTHQPLVKELIGDKGPPIECSSPKQFDVLTSHFGKHFNILNTANNHMYDMGIEGIQTTLSTLSEKNIVDIGTNRNKSEFGKAKYLLVNDIKLGLVSATFGLNGHVMPETETYHINTSNLLPRSGESDLSLLKKQIDDCKDEECDFILATMHWGFEFELFPRDRQIDAAHELIEYGADAIISHHPHVIQPIEYYKTKRDPNRVATIAYSLGSLTWGYTAPHIALSLVQNLELAKGTVNGNDVTYIAKAEVTPVFRSAFEREGKTITRLEKLGDHTEGKSTIHTPAYIEEMQRLAEVVLGKNIFKKSPSI